MTEVENAIKQVLLDTAEYRESLGVRQAKNENTPEQVVSAIDSYIVSLRDAIAVKERLPILNCVREIESRISKLQTLDQEKATEKEEALKAEFPTHFK